jgi:Domain of unknown function (DUF1851)
LESFNSVEEFCCEPAVQSIDALKNAWSWLLGNTWTPFLFSAIGDVFFEISAGTIWWLSTATGDLEQVSDCKSDFLKLLQSEAIDEWFLPGLVTYLKSEGKVLAHDECYSFHTLPVFEQGSFSAENMFVSSAKVHFETSAEVIRQLRSLKDGAKVNILIST